MIRVIRGATGIASALYLATAASVLLTGCAASPLTQVYTIKSGLKDAELVIAPTLASGKVAQSTKDAIKDDVVVAHNAVNAAEQAVQLGTGDPGAAIAAAQAALDTVNADKGL